MKMTRVLVAVLALSVATLVTGCGMRIEVYGKGSEKQKDDGQASGLQVETQPISEGGVSVKATSSKPKAKPNPEE